MMKFRANYFQLQYYIAFKEHVWNVLDPVEDYALDLNWDFSKEIFTQTGINLSRKFEVIHTIEQFGQYKAWKYGFDLYSRWFISGQLYTPFYYSTRE